MFGVVAGVEAEAGYDHEDGFGLGVDGDPSAGAGIAVVGVSWRPPENRQIVSAQLSNLTNHTAESLLDHCEKESIGFIPW